MFHPPRKNGVRLVLAVGACDRSRSPDWGTYTVDEAALRHGAGVEQETTDEKHAYARFAGREPTRYREGWLPEWTLCAKVAWNTWTSVASTPRSTSSACAASMSETTPAARRTPFEELSSLAPSSSNVLTSQPSGQARRLASRESARGGSWA